jgi:PAS domain S-box-containing protein
MIKTTTPAMPSPFKLFAIFMLLLAMIVFAGVCYFLVQKNYIVQNEQDKLAAIAELRVGQVVRWRNERLNHIEYIYNNPLFARLAKAFFENPDNTEKRQDIAAWMQSLQVRGLFAEIYLFDARGRKVLFSKNAGEVGGHAKELIAQALVNRMPVFSDLHTVPNYHFAHFDIVIPLILPETPEFVTGILFMRMNPRSGLSERIQSWPTPSLTAETLLVRRDGDSVLFLNDLRYRKDAALKLRIPLKDDNYVAVKAVNGAAGIIDGVDYRGEPALAVARKIPETPWIMIAKIDQKEIYAPLREQAWIAGTGMFFLIIVAAAAVGFWWWRQRTGFYLQLYEERKHSEERVRQLASVVENSNDAIFAMTLDGIITSWNKGAESSFGYKEPEIFGKSITLLISPDNQNETAALLKKIKERKKIEHHETVCRRKDGENVNISLSISPAMDIYGKIIGVSFIGRDVTAARRMEKKLRSSEEEYRALFESSRDAIMMLDRNRFLDCNKAALELFGVSSKEQFVTKRPSDLSPAIQPDGQDSLKAAREHIEKAYRDGTDFFEWLHIRQNGTSFHAEVLLSRLEYQGDALLQGTVRDIAGRVRMENELRRRHEQLEEQVMERTAQLRDANQLLRNEIAGRKLTEAAVARAAQEWQATFDNISDAVSLLAEDGRILKCNAAMGRMFGKTSAEIIGRHCFEIVHGTSAPVNGCPFIRARQSRRRETMELSFGGRYFTVSVDPLLDPQGLFTGAVHIISDITGRKRIEEELQKSEIKFKTVFENAGSAIFLADAETGMIMDCNSIAENLIGRRRQEIIGLPQSGLHPEPEKIKPLFFDCVKKVYYSGIEAEVLHKSGRVVPVLISGQVVTIDNRKAAIGFFFDITERKKITERLKELNDAKDRFFSIIGHDLKNMFNNILGFGDLLKEDIKTGNIETIEDKVCQINSAAGNAHNMLMELLEWANAQRGNLLFNPCSLVLNELVKEELDGLNEIAMRKNIKLKIAVPDNFKVIADKDMLKITLRNLITNAIKFSYRKGQIELRAVADGGQVEISVSDHGMGMAGETIQKLFKLGTSSSLRGTENERGTGLGLLLCDEFVKKHGGKIWAESELGKGSSFKFTLPAASENMYTL